MTVAFLWGLGPPSAPPGKRSHPLTPLRFPQALPPPLLAAERQLPAAACLFINGFIFSGFEVEGCRTARCPVCAASAPAGVTGGGRTQRQGGASTLLAAIRHCKTDHTAQTSSALYVAFQNNSFCEQRVPVLCVGCSLYFASALLIWIPKFLQAQRAWIRKTITVESCLGISYLLV